MQKTLREIAALVDGKLEGQYDENLIITGATGIALAGPSEVTFAVEPHLEEAVSCNAAAVIIQDDVEGFSKTSIKVKNPRAAFNILLNIFKPELIIERKISDKAHIGKNVKLGKNVAVMDFAYIDDNAQIDDDVMIYSNVYIGQYAKIGSNSEIHSGVSVREFCQVGKNAIIHDNTVIGADGFGFITKEGKHTKVPQVGNVVIEDDVEIGCNVGIDRATTGSTLIGRGTKIDNLVHIGHNCVLGENCLVVAQTGLAGSTIVGHNVTFAGQVGSKGHIKVGSNSVMAARTGLIADVPENSFYAGFPARSHQEWLRIKATEGRLPDMVKKLKLMEKRLKALEEKNN